MQPASSAIDRPDFPPKSMSSALSHTTCCTLALRPSPFTQSPASVSLINVQHSSFFLPVLGYISCFYDVLQRLKTCGEGYMDYGTLRCGVNLAPKMLEQTTFFYNISFAILFPSEC